jgi:hypothetical protein
MTKKWVALGASTLALVLVASTFDTAEARRGGGGGGFRGGGGHSFAARSFSGRSFAGTRFVGRSNFASAGYGRHRHFRRGFVGVPLAYGAYAYGGGGCAWLRYRALDTGSRYWWSRYYDCVNGYY